MRPIPLEMREALAEERFMKKCCLYEVGYECEGRVEWHHNLIFAGRQVNEKWAILPLCHWHHNRINQYKKKCDWVMLNRVTDEELKPFCKAIDYIGMRAKLNTEYGTRS